jgi:hypothetical protein
MSASGKKEVMSEAELKQRVIAAQANTVHGAYAFEARDEAALDVTGRSRLVELSEIVQSRSGVLGLLQERAVHAVMLCEIIESYVIEQKRAGKELEKIPALRALPAFQNSAQRCVNLLLRELRDDSNILDAGKVLEAIKNGGEDETR